jgi:iron complex outermembrane receptor protein
MGLRQEMYLAEDEADPTQETIITSTLPRLGITYKMSDQSNLFATYSKGFDPFEVSASTQIFKDPFKPVNSSLLELGLKKTFFDKKFNANFSLYNIRLQNVAVNANDITNPNLFVQRGEHASNGFETELTGNPLPDIYVNLTYAYNVAKISKSVIKTEIGQFVENAPVNSSSSWLKYQPKKNILKNWAFVFGHTQVSKRYLVQREIILPGYLTLQAGLRYVKPKWSLSMNMYNLANKTYWIGGYNSINKWPGAPRNTSIQFSYKF